MAFIVSIVEGQGEEQAVPALLHRLAEFTEFPTTLRVAPSIRVKSGSFLNDDSYFGKYIELAASKAVSYNGVVLILLDCDDGCPAQLGPQILKRARAVRGDAKYLVTLAYREFETWFIAAVESLRGKFGLPADLTCPDNFTLIRNAKGWLAERMPTGYDPVRHQHLMARAIDLDQAQAAASFRRLAQRLTTLLPD